MKKQSLVVGFSGYKPFYKIKQMADDIIGENPVIFVNFHNPDVGFGGITTTFKSIKKIIKNLSLIYYDNIPSKTKNIHRQSVYLNKELQFNYQKIYGKSYLWPLLHGLNPQIDKNQLEVGRKATKIASIIFAKKLIEVGNLWKQKKKVEPIYWLNDYLLAPVAEQLRKINPSSRIILSIRGSFNINKKIKINKKDQELLLKGMYSADFCSFHREIDVLSFFDLVENLLQKGNKDIKILQNDKTIKIKNRTMIPRAVPMGNDPYYRRFLSRSAKTKVFVKYLKKLAKNRNIISSISSFEITKGIKEELNIIETLLSLHPELVEKIVFIRVMPVRKNYDELPTYRKMEEDIFSHIERLNIKYGKNNLKPIIIFSEPEGFTDFQVAALQKISKVYLVLSTSDGFNHSSIEFLLTKSVNDVPGYLLISNIGISDYLGDSLKVVNPKNTHQCAQLLNNILLMTDKEILVKQKRLFEAANSLSSYHWTISVLSSIIRPELVPNWNNNEAVAEDRLY